MVCLGNRLNPRLPAAGARVALAHFVLFLRWILRFLLQFTGTLAVSIALIAFLKGRELARFERCNIWNGYWDEELHLCSFYGGTGRDGCPTFPPSRSPVGTPEGQWCVVAEEQLPPGRAWWRQL